MNRQHILDQMHGARPTPEAKNYLDFFLTKTGRKVSVAAAAIVSIGCICVPALPHTVFIDTFRETIQAYRTGAPRLVPEIIEERVNLAKQRLQLTDSEKENVKPFIVSCAEIIEIGSLRTQFGAWIGIPNNYEYETAWDIEKQDIAVRWDSVKWSTEHGKLLEGALVLKKDEQIFGICRAILELQTNKLLWNTLFPTFTWTSVCLTGATLNRKFDLLERPRSLRYFMYSTLAVFGYGIYTFLKDSSQVRRDKSIDHTLAELGPEMCDAGVRYYEKILNRNIAIRELSGTNLYTTRGNAHYLIRQKNLSLTSRRDFFRAKLTQYRAQQRKEDNASEQRVA